MKKLIFLTVFFSFIATSATAEGIQIIGQPGNYNIQGGDEFTVESEEILNKEVPAPKKIKKKKKVIVVRPRARTPRNDGPLYRQRNRLDDMLNNPIR